MQLAAILFALTALGGASIAAMRFSGRPFPPLWLALAHGLLGVISLGTLGSLAASQSLPFAGLVAFGMFCATAAGGLVMFLGFHLQNRPLPILFVLGHGGLAVASLVTLLAAIYG